MRGRSHRADGDARERDRARGIDAAFLASATVNGAQVDVTSSVSWTAARDDDSPAGSIGGGSLAVAPGVGGTVHVTATDGCLSATAEVSVS